MRRGRKNSSLVKRLTIPNSAALPSFDSLDHPSDGTSAGPIPLADGLIAGSLVSLLSRVGVIVLRLATQSIRDTRSLDRRLETPWSQSRR